MCLTALAREIQYIEIGIFSVNIPQIKQKTEKSFV